MAGIEWDQPMPPTLRTRWQRYADTLHELESLSLPRWTGVSPAGGLELHGFSDASERTYAAAIYLRGTGPLGQVVTSLLIAKTKVAPVKPMSIPRMELCGALLVTRLLRQMATGLSIPNHDLYAWTDAKVVLAWLRAHPSRWKPFVANRVAAIQETVPASRWHYVATNENPADAATRGFTPDELKRSSIWWEGPPWLASRCEAWPDDQPQEDSPGEERVGSLATAVRDPVANDLLVRFSSLSRLIRISAYCLRFLPGRKPDSPGFLTTAELHDCRLRWLRIVQQQDYEAELAALGRGNLIPRRSPLASLRPFLDADGLIRVGGRLRYSSLAYGEKHPIVLAKDSYLSLLLVREAHLLTLHGGPQLTRSVLVRQYWIVHANSLIRAVVHRCVRCARFKGRTATQQMGQLPIDRVRAARPFRTTGVDFAGPIALRASKGRGHKSYKGYISLFICMASRAVHLEAVSDLSAAAFLAAFRRFTARRGHCARLVSDNATNFQGAHRELRGMLGAAADTFKTCRAQLEADGTEWSFIPPAAPHFGGLWEAGVKSVKHHLRRVLGDQTLTYEELTTLLCQIEACLNSWPLCPLAADGNDLAALTPGHFLIGEAPINVPEPSTLCEAPKTLRLRWQLLSNLRDHFWYRWSREYLHHVQQLSKWRRRADNLQPGALVLIKDELRPPSKWALGRIRETLPGSDGLVRVVNVDTASTTLTRPITKICPLPVSGEEDT